MAPPRQPGPAPKAAEYSPPAGERIAILGQPRNGPVAHAIAARGGTIHAPVGLTTTMPVVAADEPYGRSTLASTAYRRAAKAIADGRALRIVSASSLGLDQKA